MTPSVCKQITVSAGGQLPFSSSGHGTTLALQGVSPSSVNSFWKYLMGTTVSVWFPTPVILAMEIHHHTPL